MYLLLPMKIRTKSYLGFWTFVWRANQPEPQIPQGSFETHKSLRTAPNLSDFGEIGPDVFFVQTALTGTSEALF
jgi:hypothetical protein